MNLKLEVESLLQVKNGLLSCCSSLDELLREIDLQEQSITCWVGQGKNAYLELLQPLRKQVESGSSRLSNSAAVLAQSLNQYIETEKQIYMDNGQLPAEDIF